MNSPDVTARMKQWNEYPKRLAIIANYLSVKYKLFCILPDFIPCKCGYTYVEFYDKDDIRLIIRLVWNYDSEDFSIYSEPLYRDGLKGTRLKSMFRLVLYETRCILRGINGLRSQNDR